MSKMKEKNLRRFVALYIAGSVAFGGVAYAAEEENEPHFLEGATTVINDDAWTDDSAYGGSQNGSVNASNITIGSNGKVSEVVGGGYVHSGANNPANVDQVTIKINGGEVVDLFGGGQAMNGGTANITRKSTIEITGGTVENVTGGGSANSGHAAVKESEITINEGSRIGFFQGGGDAKGDNATANVDKATITINGGTFGGAIGDNDYSDESFGGGFANVAVTEGKTNTSNVGDITINIHNGTFKNNVYGGGMATVEDEDVKTPVLGSASTHVKNVKIAIDGNVKTEGDVTIYAGGATLGDRTKSSVDNAEITISGNAHLLEVNGGADADGGSGTASVGTSKITVSGNANITNGIVGGGYADNGGSATVKDSTIEINGGTVGMVAGGGAAYGDGTTSTETSTININNTSKIETIIGGGSAENGTTHVGTSNITVNNGSIGYIQGGGDADYDEAKSTVDTVNITVKNGNIGLGSTPGDDMTFSGIVGGGMAWVGEDEDETNESNVKTVKLNIAGGTIHNATGENVVSGVFGGGIAGYTHGTGAPTTADAKVHVDSVNMEISGGTIETDVYAGGATFDESDDSSGTGKATSTVDNATINISGGDIKGSVYAGGMNEATVNNTTINISSGTVSGDISRGNATAAALNFTAGTGSTIGGMISGFDTVTVREDAMTTLTGADMNADESHGFTTLAVEQRGTLNISGGTFNADITGAGATKKSALNFTAGKGSTISKTVSGFDTVTVATGAKTDWTGENLTHTFGSLTVAEGGTINIGKATIFDFAQGSSAAAYSITARTVQNGNFNIAGAVNLAQGTTLTMQNGTVTTTGKGAFFSEVDKDNFADSGKVAWGTGTKVEGELQTGFTNLTNSELVDMGKTDKFGDLLTITMNPENLTAGQVIKNPKAGLTSFEAKINPDGTLNIIDAPHTSERGVGYYTGVRQGNAYINHTIVENIHEHTAGLRNGEKGNEFWASIRGGSTDVDTGFGEAEVKTQYYQLGYDWDLSTDKQKTAIGLYFTKISGDSTQNGFKNDIDSAYDFGIYGTKEFGGGNYVSLIGRYGQIGNSLRTDVQTTEWKDKGYGLSMEFGNRNTQANGLMLEPYIQFNYNHYSSADFTVGADRAGMDSDSMLDGKLGLRLIKQEADNPNNTIFGGIAYTKGLSGDFSLRDRTNGEKLGGTDNDASAFELSVGVNRQISKCSTVNLNAKKEFGDYDGWSVQGMVNVNF